MSLKTFCLENAACDKRTRNTDMTEVTERWYHCLHLQVNPSTYPDPISQNVYLLPPFDQYMYDSLCLIRSVFHREIVTSSGWQTETSEFHNEIRIQK